MAFTDTASVLVAVLSLWSLYTTVWLVILSTSSVYQDVMDCSVIKEALSSITESQTQQPLVSTSNSKPHHPTIPRLHEDATVESRLLQYYAQIFSWADVSDEKCTLVLLVWHKNALKYLLSHYCSRFIFKRVVIVWNNMAVPIQKTWTIRCLLEIKIINSSTDKLTNRYLAWKEVGTDCE